MRSTLIILSLLLLAIVVFSAPPQPLGHRDIARRPISPNHHDNGLHKGWLKHKDSHEKKKHGSTEESSDEGKHPHGAPGGHGRPGGSSENRGGHGQGGHGG
ncbi:unnamed protein product, partial [Rotaria sp. Silwood1]